MNNLVEVSELPQCDFCDSSAQYDGATSDGAWAYMCASHFRLFGIGLGLGKGQKLVIINKKSQKGGTYDN